jgi:hypothetical protein
MLSIFVPNMLLKYALSGDGEQKKKEEGFFFVIQIRRISTKYT